MTDLIDTPEATYLDDVHLVETQNDLATLDFAGDLTTAHWYELITGPDAGPTAFWAQGQYGGVVINLDYHDLATVIAEIGSIFGRPVYLVPPDVLAGYLETREALEALGEYPE